MKDTAPETKVQLKVKSNDRSAEQANTKVEVSRGAMLAIGTVPALIGLWAVACFIGGMVATGGPLAMAKSWFMAVTGM